jgi:hypothetical protein
VDQCDDTAAGNDWPMTHIMIYLMIFWGLVMVALSLGILISIKEDVDEKLYSSDSARFWPAQDKGENDGEREV